MKTIKNSHLYKILIITQPAITCSKLTIETLEQGMKYVQSYVQGHQNEPMGSF